LLVLRWRCRIINPEWEQWYLKAIGSTMIGLFDMICLKLLRTKLRETSFSRFDQFNLLVIPQLNVFIYVHNHHFTKSCFNINFARYHLWFKIVLDTPTWGVTLLFVKCRSRLVALTKGTDNQGHRGRTLYLISLIKVSQIARLQLLLLSQRRCLSKFLPDILTWSNLFKSLLSSCYSLSHFCLYALLFAWLLL